MVQIIGNVVAKGEGRFEWIIPHFSTIPRKTRKVFFSPDFEAEGDEWGLCIHPNGRGANTRIGFTLIKIFSSNPKSLSCTVGVKRADHSQETIGTETCGGYRDNETEFIFNKRRRELESGEWLLDDQLTVTCLIGQAHAPRAKRKLTSSETKTDALDTKVRKVERLENCTCIGAKGVARVLKNVKELLSPENEDYDLRILVKGKEFRAHKIILKTQSSVFRMMLTHDSKEKNTGTIRIEDCDPDSFDAFLLFVYSGRAENLTTSKALSLYYAADKYDFPDLKEECVTFLKTTLSMAFVCDVIHLATLHEDKELLRTATEFFAENIHEILPTAEWRDFLHNYTDQANELYMIALKSICPQK